MPIGSRIISSEGSRAVRAPVEPGVNVGTATDSSLDSKETEPLPSSARVTVEFTTMWRMLSCFIHSCITFVGTKGLGGSLGCSFQKWASTATDKGEAITSLETWRRGLGGLKSLPGGKTSGSPSGVHS